MRSEKRATNLHPGLETLALYSSRDLPLTLRWRVRRHLARCPDCEQQVSLFRAAKAELRREASVGTLTGFEAITDLSRLEQEMLGNIAVGVAAARCVDSVHHGRKLVLRAAFAAGLSGLFVAGWLTHIPNQDTERLTASVRRLFGLERPQMNGTVLRTTPDGIMVRTDGATLTMMHPASAVVSQSGTFIVAARYIDEQTGQVTITKVYGQ